MSTENTPVTPYSSSEELARDMSDPRYMGSVESPPDASFVAHVLARMNAAPVAPPAKEPAPVFRTVDDVVEAMKDPRYKTDAEYRNEVTERLKYVHLAVSTGRRCELQYDGKGGFIDVEQARHEEYARQHYAKLAAMQPVEVPGIGPVLPFASREEMAEAMNTAAYRNGDPATHAVVRARLSVSRF